MIKGYISAIHKITFSIFGELMRGGKLDLSYKNKIPQGIIDIFEKHGFIWGGKWYHYDTMHFEYRPELLY